MADYFIAIAGTWVVVGLLWETILRDTPQCKSRCKVLSLSWPISLPFAALAARKEASLVDRFSILVAWFVGIMVMWLALEALA